MDLESVLETYRRRAPRSLRGPGPGGDGDAAAAAATAPPPAPPPAPRESAAPLLSAPDRGRGEREVTPLEGKPILCFSVGGERRLCLPQILNTVLTHFKLDQINRVCDELQIYCSRCTPEQLHELKATGVLPKSAPSCGLITKTDAQRLCGALLHGGGNAETEEESPSSDSDSFRVYHECFGKCRGVCSPRLGVVECRECLRSLSPRRFVCHAHGDRENRTCHWGFDADNWRDYLLVDEDQPDRERLEAALDEIARRERRQRHDHRRQHNNHHHHHHHLLKRRVQVEQMCKSEPLEVPLKKPNMEDIYGYIYAMDHHPYIHAAAIYDQYRSLSAFRPFLSAVREPPLLQHPEKVVPLEESASYLPTYQPNVALKPQNPPTPPSSDEITSSTSPPPPEAPPAQPPPPECELSTDTDDEDCKRTSSSELTDVDRLLRQKDTIIAEQAEVIREKDEIISKQEALILELEDKLRRSELIVSERDEKIRSLGSASVKTEDDSKPATVIVVKTEPDEDDKASPEPPAPPPPPSFEEHHDVKAEPE